MATDSERIEELTDEILASMTKLCLKTSCTDVELYIATRYFLTRLQAAVGPERVKKLEKSFIIVAPPTSGTVC